MLLFRYFIDLTEFATVIDALASVNHCERKIAEIITAIIALPQMCTEQLF